MRYEWRETTRLRNTATMKSIQYNTYDERYIFVNVCDNVIETNTFVHTRKHIHVNEYI